VSHQLPRGLYTVATCEGQTIMRWSVEITYRTAHPAEAFHLIDLAELNDIIRRGPDLWTVDSIVIRRLPLNLTEDRP
jgi:hypothetical protein